MAKKIIHSRKLFGGRETAEGVHRRVAWSGITCQACASRRVVIVIRSFAPVIEFMTKMPDEAAAAIEFLGDAGIPTTQSKYGPLVKLAVVGACAEHRQIAEHIAAKLPSWIVVEIDRGPGVDRPSVQVPG